MPNTNPYPCCGYNAPVIVQTAICYQWQWASDDPASETLNSITFINSGGQSINVLLDDGEAALIAGIESALDAAGFVYDGVFVNIIVPTPPALSPTLYTFTIASSVINPADYPSQYDIQGNEDLINVVTCPL